MYQEEELGLFCFILVEVIKKKFMSWSTKKRIRIILLYSFRSNKKKVYVLVYQEKELGLFCFILLEVIKKKFMSWSTKKKN